MSENDSYSNNNKMPHNLVVMGVSGSGKSTIAGILADRIGCIVAEADDFHSPENIAKMSSGVPLTDEDRKPWLHSLRDWMDEHNDADRCTIITCSALKRSYRDFLRTAKAPVTFIHLNGSRELLAARLSKRTQHFMPLSLLDSQLATLEPLQPDEPGYAVDIDATPSEICTDIMNKLGIENVRDRASTSDKSAPYADIGIYGLGVMGSSIARNLARHGSRVAIFNIDATATKKFIAKYGEEGDFYPTYTESDFAAAVRPPRVAVISVTSGDITEEVTERLARQFSRGDIIVDMGNSHFQDTRRREAKLRERGLNFVGCGISGGQEGALNGPSLMVGGSKEAWARLAPIYMPIAAKAPDGRACCAHVGADGAGHFVKMVHNGIEYADMQLLSEVYTILREAGMSAAQVGDIFEKWNEGALGSYLLEITTDILHHADPETGSAFIDIVADAAGHKGTGTWASIESFQLGTPATIISAAVYARYISSQAKLRGRVQEVLGKRTRQSADVNIDMLVADLHDAAYAAKIVCYAQGLDLIRAGANAYGWEIDLAEVAEIWRAGCIIRANFLDEVAKAYRAQTTEESLLVSPVFAKRLRENEAAWQHIVQFTAQTGTPVPVLNTARDYLQSLRSSRLGTELIQAQRDYFGSHTYQRTDKSGTYHTHWKQDPVTEVRVDK